MARPAGLEPATSWFVGRSEEATGGSLRLLPPVLLGFSTPETTLGNLEPLPIVSHLSVGFGPSSIDERGQGVVRRCINRRAGKANVPDEAISLTSRRESDPSGRFGRPLFSSCVRLD